jgi:hypothetical protein
MTIWEKCSMHTKHPKEKRPYEIQEDHLASKIVPG